jgi:hypothetical protein
VSTCLSELALEDEPMEALLVHSITYRIAEGARAGRRVFRLQLVRNPRGVLVPGESPPPKHDPVAVLTTDASPGRLNRVRAGTVRHCTI